MNGQGHAENILEGLSSGSIESQCAALESAKHLFSDIAEAAVAALECGPERFIIAERINWLGSACEQPLKRVLGCGVEEVRVLAALVLLQMDSRDGVEILKDAITNGSEYSGLVASWLAKKKIDGVVEVVLARLEECPLDKFDEIVSLVLALRVLGGELPLALVQRFRDSRSPWQIRTLVQ
jgi:hypothetical protein